MIEPNVARFARLSPPPGALPGAILCLCLCEVAAMSQTARPSPEAAPHLDLPAASPSNGVLLDGSGRDAIWAQAAELPPLRLAADYRCEPAAASRACAVRAGKWLVVGFDADEPDDVVAREAMHGASLWREDAMAVEIKGAAALRVLVNPLGAICCYRGDKATMTPVTKRTVRAAARIGTNGWRVELAVALAEVLPAAGAPGEVAIRISRYRQQRGLTPFEETAAPAKDRPPLLLRVGEGWRKAPAMPIAVGPAQQFAARAGLEAARLDGPPASDAAWAKAPAVQLRSEDGRAAVDAAFQRTEVRACATGERLVLRIRCEEAWSASIDARGEALWAEDGVEVFLGPERFGYLQLMTNPDGVLKAARGRTGGRRIGVIDPPAGVCVEAQRAAKAWTVTLSVPFRTVLDFTAAPAERVPSAHPWRIQVVRNRPPRAALGQAGQVSVLNVTHSGNAHCPARFGVLRVVPAVGERAAAARPRRPELPPPVLDARQRKRLGAASLLGRRLDARTAGLHAADEEQFRKIDGPDAWRRRAAALRRKLAEAMFPATGGKWPARCDLEAEEVYDLPGEGFRCRGVIFQSQPGLPVPATLYVPSAGAKRAGTKRPALIMVPAHHTGRNSRDLVVLGANFARAGGVAMAMESIGSGERAVAAPWAHKNHQRNVLGVQVYLAGDNLAGWTALDISRGVDYLLARGDVDPARIALVGGVAGGGDVTAAAAALDERIAVSIPFNFSTCAAMEAWYDPLRSYHGAHAGGLSAWAVDALVAPRRLVQAQEFAWGAGERASYERFAKVYGWLGAAGHLARLHGGPNTHATHYNWMHRVPLYELLGRWFAMKLPAGRAEELTDVPGAGGLECFEKPRGRVYLSRLASAGRLREPHERAAELAAARLTAARKACLRAASRGGGKLADALAERFTRLLGDTSPVLPAAKPAERDLGTWRGARVWGVWLAGEGDQEPPGVAAWLLLPTRGVKRPAVLGVCEAGKARFLAERADEAVSLLAAGVAVCLVDVRGCGEASPGASRLPDGPSAYLAYHLWCLGESLPVGQLRDVRTALAWLAARDDVDAGRLGLWGEGFAAPNGRAGERMLFDEVGFRQASPAPKRPAEPLGGMLAMLAGLWPVEAPGGPRCVRAVLVRGGLVSFASVLERRCHYVPVDAVVPGLLRAADVPLLAEALCDAGASLHAEDLRDGSNRRVGAERLGRCWPAGLPVGFAERAGGRGPAALTAALAGKAD